MALSTRQLLACLCVMLTLHPLHADNYLADVASDHGIGVLKQITNHTSQPVLIRFADSAYPPIKPHDSTDSFSSENVPLKAAAVFGSTMLMGIVGLAAMKLNPQDRINQAQEKINRPSQEFDEKVEAEKEKLSNPSAQDGDSEGEEGTPSSGTSKSGTGSTPSAKAAAAGTSDATAGDEIAKERAKAETQWSGYADKLRAQQDAEHEAKLNDPNLSDADKKKLLKDAEKRQKAREKADSEPQRLQDAQNKGGIRGTLKADAINTKNEWFNEKSDFGREISQWKGMRGKNTTADREQETAFQNALRTMTPAERKAAQAERDAQKKNQPPIDSDAEKKKFWAGARAAGGFTNADGSAMSKGQMVKKVLWGRALGKDDPAPKKAKTRKEKLKGIAKFAATGALIAAVPTTVAALSEVIGDTPSNIITNLLPWEIPDGKFRCPISQMPLLLGFGSTMLTNFREGSTLQIKRLMGLGGVWLQNPLPTPLSFTLTFKLRVNDAGGAHIMLRKGLDFGTVAADGDIGFSTKIMLGAFNNTVAAISDNGTIVAQVRNDQYAAAAIPPGIFTPYWLSYDSGLIMLGLGQPGTNVIISWHDPDFDPTIDHIGLSCDKSEVEFTELYFGPAVSSSIIPKEYISIPNEMPLSNSTTWLSHPLREPGRGTICLQKKGSGPAVISIALSADDSAPQLKIPIGSAQSLPITVQYTDSASGQPVEEQIGVVCDPYQVDETNYETYWISNLYGQFTIGHSQPTVSSSGTLQPPKPGSNLIACVTIPDLASASAIGLSIDPDLTSNNDISVKNISIHPAVELEENIPEGYVERRKFVGNLQITYPFAYQFRQAGQSIEVHDQISGQTFYPAATPQQMATYFFNAAIMADGTMTMAEVSKPKNPAKFGMAAGAVALQQAAGLLNTTATQIGQSGYDIISQIITAGASIGLAGVAIGVNVASSALNANAKYGFRDEHSYVYTEQVKRQIDADASIPQEIQTNIATINDLVTSAEQYKQAIADRFSISKVSSAGAQLGMYATSSAENRTQQQNFFEQYVTSYKKIISLIIHPAIMSNKTLKTKIANALFYINQSIGVLYNGPSDGPQKAIITQAIITLFLDAQQNGYLLDPKISDDQKRSKMWAEWVQNLLDASLSSSTQQAITINPMFGQYLWLTGPLTFAIPDNGSVYFEAQGVGDVFVGLIDSPSEVRNTEKDIYEMVFGGSDNTASFLRVKSLGRSVAEVLASEDPNAAVDTISGSKCWVSFKNGIISAGKGGWGEGKLLEWKDPYPLSGIRYVGLSTWSNPVTFSNIHVGPAVEDLTPEIREKILTSPTQAATSQEQQAKDALMKDQFTDLSNDNDPLVNDILTQNDIDYSDPLAYDELSAPELDQLTHDVLENDILMASPTTPQASTPAASAAKKAAATSSSPNKPSDQDNLTAAQQRQMLMQQATGGLGGLFQEWHTVMGSKTKKKQKNTDQQNEEPGVARRLPFFRKKAAKSDPGTENTGSQPSASGASNTASAAPQSPSAPQQGTGGATPSTSGTVSAPAAPPPSSPPPSAPPASPPA